MGAKVFADSIDVIQDQAKVLYEYLIRVAKKIVDEEVRIEGEIASKEEDRTEAEEVIKSQNTIMISCFVAGGVLGIAGFIIGAISYLLWILCVGSAIYGVVSLLKKNKAQLLKIKLESNILVFREEFNSIRRDYKVHRLGVAYIPVATRIPFEGKSFILDHTKSVSPQEFILYNIKNQDAFVKNIQEIDGALEKIPMVEGSQAMEEVNTGEYSKSIQQVSYYDYMGALDRNMRGASFYLNDLERNSVSMPVIDPKSSYAKFLRDHGTTEATFGSVLSVFPSDEQKGEIEKFKALNEMKKSMEGQTAKFEEYLQKLMDRLASTIQLVTKVKIGSTDHLVTNSNKILFASLNSSYNHYSPQLESEEIERIRVERFDYQESVDSYRPFELKKSSRVLYDAISGNWVSIDGRRTSFPFGINQIQEEIIGPILRNLMQETRIERMKMYSDIKDQKLDYLNQWHRDTDDFYGRNRAEGSNLINLMQGSLTEFTASFNQYKAFEETQKKMASSGSLAASQVSASGSSDESVAAYEVKSAEFRKVQDEFNEYIVRLKEEIDRKAVDFGYTEFYDASLCDSGSRDFAGSMSRMDALNERRKNLLAVNAYFAETADLPPQPDIGEEVQKGLSLNLKQAVKEFKEEKDINNPASPAKAVELPKVDLQEKTPPPATAKKESKRKPEVR